MKYIIKEDSPFLGSLAGTPAKISSHEGKNLFTEGRVYQDEENKFYTPGARIVTVREELAKPDKGRNGDYYKMVGDKNHDNGTYFQTVYTCKDYSNPGRGPMDNCFGYALQTFGSKLEKIATKEMSEIVDSVHSSIDNAVMNYFEPVIDSPQDGDLVVYQSQYFRHLSTNDCIKAESNTHAGIYRDTKSNGNSPNGGTVESKWGFWGNEFVFQHDMFFVPTGYGDIVKFYRLKSESSLEEIPSVQEDLSLNGETIDFTYSF